MSPRRPQDFGPGGDDLGGVPDEHQAASSTPATSIWSRSNDPLKDLLDRLPESVIVYDENFVIVYASKAASELIGHHPDAIIGQDRIIVDAQYLPMVWEARQAAMAGGRPTYVVKVSMPEGRSRWLEVALARSPDPMSPGNSVFIETARSADRLMAALDEHVRANHYFYGLAEAVDVAVLIVDSDLTIQKSNTKAQQLFKHHSESLTGAPLFQRLWIG